MIYLLNRKSIIFVLFLILVLPKLAFNQNVSAPVCAYCNVSLNGTTNFDHKGDCPSHVCPNCGTKLKNGQRTCTSPSCSSKASSSSSSSKPKSASSYSNDLNIMIVETVLDAAMKAVNKSIANKKEREAIEAAEEEAAAKAAEDAAVLEKARDEGARLKWAKLQQQNNNAPISNTSPKSDYTSDIIPVEGAGLFNTVSVKLDAQEISQDNYPAPEGIENQLACACYFSKMAANATSDEEARFYSSQADKVMIGRPTSVECQYCEKPNPPESNEKIEKIKVEIDIQLQLIQKNEKELSELDEQIKKIDTKKTELNQQIEQLKDKVNSVPPENKSEIDALTQQAIRELNQVEEQEKKAIEIKNSKTELINQSKSQIGNLQSELNSSLPK